jgi:hypothetical protein
MLILWFKFTLIEELTYVIDVYVQEKFLTMMRWAQCLSSPLGLKFWLGNFFKAVTFPYLLLIRRCLNIEMYITLYPRRSRCITNTSSHFFTYTQVSCGVLDRTKECHLSLSSVDVVKATKGLTALHLTKTAIGLPPVTSAVFLTAKYLRSLCCFGDKA